MDKYPEYCATCNHYLGGFCQRKVGEHIGTTAQWWPKCERLDWCPKWEKVTDFFMILNGRRFEFDASKWPITGSEAESMASTKLYLEPRKIYFEKDLSKPIDMNTLIPKGAELWALSEARPW